MNQLITIEDQTSPGTITPRELFSICWSLSYQAVYQYGRSPWVEHGYAPAAHAMLLPKGAQPPLGAWNLILMDWSTEAGTLGFHADETGTGIPFGEVFVETIRQDGVEPSEVASHEMLEMLVDPNVAEPRKALNAVAKEWVIVEVGDPVEGRGYDVGAPEGRETGVIVADFAYPLWWREPQTRAACSFTEDPTLWAKGSTPNRGLQPFELAPGGYISVMPTTGGEWEQIYGAGRDQVPAWDKPDAS